MNRSSLVTGFFVLVLLLLLGTGISGPRDPLPDAEVAQQFGEGYPQEAHMTLYREHLARMDAEPGDCR